MCQVEREQVKWISCSCCSAQFRCRYSRDPYLQMGSAMKYGVILSNWWRSENKGNEFIMACAWYMEQYGSSSLRWESECSLETLYSLATGSILLKSLLNWRGILYYTELLKKDTWQYRHQVLKGRRDQTCWFWWHGKGWAPHKLHIMLKCFKIIIITWVVWYRSVFKLKLQCKLFI